MGKEKVVYKIKIIINISLLQVSSLFFPTGRWLLLDINLMISILRKHVRHKIIKNIERQQSPSVHACSGHLRAQHFQPAANHIQETVYHPFITLKSAKANRLVSKQNFLPLASMLCHSIGQSWMLWLGLCHLY